MNGPTPSADPQFLSVADVAASLAVSADTVLAWIHSRSLIATDVSRGRGERPRWRIDRAALDTFIAARSTSSPASPPVRSRRPDGIPRYV